MTDENLYHGDDLAARPMISFYTILSAFLTSLHIHRPALEDQVGSKFLSPDIALQIFKHKAAFLQKSDQVNGI